jgi:tetratricopeptide (TPR) repeat protein
MVKLPKSIFLTFLVLTATVFAQAPAPAQPAKASTFEQQLAKARAAYFLDLQGDSNAASIAKKDFRALQAEAPNNSVVMAYSGSLVLLEAARTWAFWNKKSLSQKGLAEMDKAVAMDPDNLEARFIRGASCWHLPFFFHRKQQAEQDLTFVAVRATRAVKDGKLPPQLGAAALDYYGNILENHNQHAEAQQAFREAMRIDPESPGGKDAASHLDRNS